MSPNTQAGPYLLGSPLGAGGMGEVYRARDTRLDREVAIKVLPRGLASDAERLRRFRQEARTLAALNHPNILTVFDVGEHEGVPFLVCELLEGRTFREEMAGTPPGPRKILDYAVQITRGLGAAHAKGVIHRDLKPENLMVTGDGRVKILDFGLSKFQQRPGEGESDATTQSGSTAPGRLMGTPAYMAPEQVRGEEADATSDLFALGVVLAEWMGGRHPFRRGSVIETLSAILRDEPELGFDRLGDVGLGLARIVQRCLEKEPARRFQSAPDLGFALEHLTGLDAVVPVVEAVVGGSPGSIRSLAVKPLDDFCGDASQAYLSDGMTEALCSALGNISALRVPGRSSVMRYKGAAKSIREMAGELDVDAIVEGSVQRAGTRLLVMVRLIDAARDRQIWSTQAERDLGEFFQLQSEVARAIAGEIRVRLTPADDARLAHARPAHRDAVEACLLGMHHWWRWSDEGFAAARGYFRKAIEADPTHAPAHAGEALNFGFASSYLLSPREAMPAVSAAAERAIRLDPDLADGYAARAKFRWFYEWDWVGAERDFRRALELSPNASVASDEYQTFLVSQGRFDEALRVLEEAIVHEPLNAGLHSDLGCVCYYAGRPEAGIPHHLKALELEPGFSQSRIFLGWAYQFTGRADEALEAFRAASERAPNTPWAQATYGYALGRIGRREEALQKLADLERIAATRYVSRVSQVYIQLGLGERQTALDWLEKACDDRDAQMPFLKVSPVLAELRDEPRYQALLRRVGLR